MKSFLICLSVFVLFLNLESSRAASLESLFQPDMMRYYRAETERIARQSQSRLNEIDSSDSWEQLKPVMRRELFDMLGMDPIPERTPLQATVTGSIEREGIVVEKLHFQSSPGLYVTANLYRPAEVEEPLPAILYVCGHGRVVRDGVSYGNKAHYQHHGVWFARNGYVCMLIDTIQLGEIEGIHHGTYRYDEWWWNSRGYTPAGVEAWNSMRAIDYLQSRPEVDGERIGMTGRSGGGAYSWWTAALDERVKVVAPVAGITDMHNHVVDGVVEGHCDCMYMVNTFQWDFNQLASLMAPRPLLICNTDSDGIFPLDGVVRVFNDVRGVYREIDAEDRVGLVITPGPHQDTQSLRVPVFHWMNEHLKGEDPLIEEAAVPLFEPEELKVFETLPEDERVTSIQRSFVEQQIETELPETESDWNDLRSRWMNKLGTRVFGAWPEEEPPAPLTIVDRKTANGVELQLARMESAPGIHLPVHILQPADAKAERIEITVSDNEAWDSHFLLFQTVFPDAYPDSTPLTAKLRAMAAQEQRRIGEQKVARILVAPLGVGPAGFDLDERGVTQLRRRFMLLGRTLDSFRVRQLVQLLEAIHAHDAFAGRPVTLYSERGMGVNVLLANLMSDGVDRLDLNGLPADFEQAPDYLNIMRFLTLPQLVAMNLRTTEVRIHDPEPENWEWPGQIAARFHTGQNQLEVVP